MMQNRIRGYSQDFEVKRRSYVKICDGDISVTVKILCSDETYKAPDKPSLDLVMFTHPHHPLDGWASPSPTAALFSVGLAMELTANCSEIFLAKVTRRG